MPARVPGPGGHLIPFNPLKNVAFHALDHAYSIGYIVCGSAATLSFLLAVVALGGRQRAQPPVAERDQREPAASLV